MKIDMELKPGDIVLLKLLACLLIAFFAGRFLIFPAIEKHQDLVARKETVEETKQQMQDTIDNAPAVEELIKKQEEALAQEKEGYYDLLENRETDELVTGIVLKHNLFPVYLNISEAEPGIPAAYLNTETADTAAAADDTESTDLDTDTGDSAESDDTAATTAETTVYIQYTNSTAVNLTVRGSEDEIRSFLDDLVRNYPGVQLRSYQLSDGSYVTDNLEMRDATTCMCVLAVYTCGEIGGAQ